MPEQTRMPSAAEEAEGAEVPHAFFTHMGLPEGVGVFNLRPAGLATRAEGKRDGDFAFHLETGLTRAIGLHIRNDRFLDVPRTEAMFQFAVITSRDGMSGFAPLIEFEVPHALGRRQPPQHAARVHLHARQPGRRVQLGAPLRPA